MRSCSKWSGDEGDPRLWGLVAQGNSKAGVQQLFLLSGFDVNMGLLQCSYGVKVGSCGGGGSSLCSTSAWFDSEDGQMVRRCVGVSV
jgi:hypothetical protein